MKIVIDMTGRDFDRLCNVSMEWGEHWRKHDGRFEHGDGENAAAPRYEWKMAYWVGDSATSMILARSWLTSNGFESELLFDTYENPNGSLIGYVLLTDYVGGE